MWRNLWRGQLKASRQAGFSVMLMLLAMLAGFGFSPTAVHARGPAPSRLEAMASSQLTPNGREMLALIYRGGPFRHDKDGTAFGNRERILPAMHRGYYREYTVRTPGERSRGAQRIVCGGQQPAVPDACYYTDDHYASFRKIVQ